MAKRVTPVLTMVLSLILLTSCGVDDIDISDYKDKTITIAGLTDKEINITVEELKSLGCITKKTESTSDKIGTVKATGPLLTTLVESYGHDLKDYSKVIIYAQDDYDIKLNAEFLSENQVILAIGMDGEPLDTEDIPVRIIIPKSDSAYWIRMVNKLEFVE